MNAMRSFLLATTLFIVSFVGTAQADIPTLEFPLPGLPDESRIISGFGNHWLNRYCKGNRQLHTGVDFSASVGTSVESAYAGTVVYVRVYNGNPYNEMNFITISHGLFTTTYHHIRPIVSKGQYVSMGQKIAEINYHSNGSHLHFAVRDKSYDGSYLFHIGRLPEVSCGGDPEFPKYFVDPANLDYHW